MARRRITHQDGLAALAAVSDDATGQVTRQQLATAVRYLLEELAELAPGKSVEVRVPPFGAVQCVGGLSHTRGTPPNVIETDAETWIGLAMGTLDWESALADARVFASGSRANLAGLLPVLRGGVRSAGHSDPPDA